jgi:hypothetical protein
MALVFPTPDKGEDVEHQANLLKRRNARKARARQKALESPIGDGTAYPSQLRYCALDGCRASWEAVTRRRDARYCARRCKERAKVTRKAS